MLSDSIYNNRNKFFYGSLFFYLVFIIWRIIHVPLFDDKGARNAIHGDAYSDINTYSAALFFKDSGFSKSAFLPMFYYADATSIRSNPAVYTHYPSLPDVLAGCYAKIFDTRSEKVLRIIPVCISLIFFMFIFFALQKIIPDKKAALLSALIIVWSNYFIFWGDNLHKHLYEEFFKWIYVFALWNYFKEGRKNKIQLLLIALLYIIITNVSFEPVVFLAIVTVGLGLIFTRKLFIAENFFLLLMPVVGFSLHLYQNFCYYGEWHLVINDFKDAALLRTQGGADVRNELHRNVELKDYLTIPITLLNRIERYFLLPGYALLVFGYLAIKKWSAENVQLKQFAIVLILATVSWSIFMTQHFTVHAFTGRHVGILYAVLIGTGLIEYEKLLVKHLHEKQKFFIALHVLFIAYNVAMLLSQQVLDIFKYGFLL